MPKTPSSKLFHLIKSLSGPEKRYFKVHIGSQGQKDNKYVLLFDAIDAQEAFDESALKRYVYGDQIIQSRKYSELKSYLYDHILKSLQAYDEKSSVMYRLKNMLKSVQVLFRRSLFEDCLQHLVKAKKLAYKYEQFTSVLEILGWEKHIAYTRTDIDFLDKELERIDAEEKKTLKRLRTISEYRNIFFRLLVSMRKDDSLSGEVFKNRLENLVQSPLLKDFSLADSYQSQVLYYRIFSVYAYATREQESFYNYGKKLIALMESQRHMLQEDVSEYISVLNNFIRSCGETKRIREMEQNLEKLYKVKPNSKDDELKIHRQYYQAKLSLITAQGQFTQGMQVLEQHLKERKQFDISLFQSHSFYFNYFHITFGAGKYERALEFLNDWLNLPNTVERQDLQVVARILNLLVHFELKNYVLLESLIRSTQRFLKKKDKLQEVEKKIIHFIKKASETPSKRELREAYEGLRKEFEDLSQQPATKTFFAKAFDIMSWLESKIEGKSFAEIVQRKFETHYPLKE